MGAAAWKASEAEAAVVCRRGAKKVRLRAEACKAKETLVFDTSEVGVERGRVDQNAGRLDDQGQRVEGLEATFSQTCPGDAARRVAPITIFNGPGTGGCRTHDGDQAACEQAFQLHEGGGAACTYLGGNCVPCHLGLDIAGFCENVCNPTSCIDPARIVPVTSCNGVAGQPACEQAWTITGGFPTTEQYVKGTTCYWDAIMLDCRTCGPSQISEGKCQNTCLAPEDIPACAAAGRTYGDCGALDGNQAGCLATYEFGEQAGTHTCWYDAGQCEPCLPEDEFQGKCANLC